MQSAARPAKLSVGVEVLQFAAAGRKLSATGLVTAKLTDDRGHVTAVRTRSRRREPRRREH